MQRDTANVKIIQTARDILGADGRQGVGAKGKGGVQAQLSRTALLQLPRSPMGYSKLKRRMVFILDVVHMELSEYN